ncbi:MAG: T9SS type A sorting domain-containing protein, partial [Saprospiraceae bacterium]
YICLNDRNWLFCEQPITNNELFVVQQLPRNTSLNGTILGDFPQETVVGDLGICLGPDYGPFTNTLDLPTNIYKCPEDPVILRIPDLELPSAAGLCLFVSVYSLADSLLAAATYTLDDFSGDEVDVSGLLNPLGDGNFIFELSLRCCELPEVDCPAVNATRRTYIRVFPDLFAYDLTLEIIGSIFGECLRTSYFLPITPPGKIINIGDDDCDTYHFRLRNIANYGDEGISIFVSTKPCASPGEYIPLDGNASYTTAQLADGTQNTGSLNPIVPEACDCYRVDVNYYSTCVQAYRTRSSYYRIGENCSEAPTAVLDNPAGPAQFTLSPNPVGEALSITYSGEESVDRFTLELYDLLGQRVKSVEVPRFLSSYRVSLDVPAGAYHYSIRWGGGRQTGMLIKQ